MTEFEPDQRVEWRSQADQAWTASGIYLGPDDGLGDPWGQVDTTDGVMLVRAHLLRPEGHFAAADAELADLIERSKGYPIGDDGHAAECRRYGWPWCDTCKRPSVWSEFRGTMHTTTEHPHGVPAHLDDSGHEVTHREWWRVPR